MVLKGLLRSATLVISSMLMAAKAYCVPSRALNQFLCHSALGGKWVHCMLEFRMSRQLYILRSRGHQQIDKMKGFRGDWAEL